ncbi:MAG: septal ring lytic transglycosylase RlpA family protein [Bacteroidota bacterium]|jgi:rare lipoprotein A
MILKSVFAFVYIAVFNLISPPTEDKIVSGKASYYAHKFEGKRTSSGQRYRGKVRTAAHRTYPFGTLLEVTNRANGSKTIVRVNDRGPHSRSRLLDVSYSAAKDLGLIGSGTAEVSIKVVQLGTGFLADNQDEELMIEEGEATAQVTPSFPTFSETKHQYMVLVKNADGSVKVEYSDTRPNL